MFQTIKRLFGQEAPPRINLDPFGREAERKEQKAQTAQLAESLERREALPVVLREELLDAKTRIAGYRFSTAWSASLEPSQVKATVEALKRENVAEFGARRMALIPVLAHNWFRADHAALAAPRTVFLLDAPPPDAFGLERWREVCAAIRASGARVALSGIEVGRDKNDGDAVLDQVDVFHLDFTAYSLDNFETTLARIARNYPKMETVVSGLAGWAERRLCAARGANYCMGPFASSPDAQQQSGEINQGRLALIEMLNLLRRDADLDEIAEVAKRHPETALKIVAMANSPMQGLAKPVASIDQAVMILGRKELYRWLSIGMYRAGGDTPRDAVLLELALSRGRFLELAGAQHFAKPECEELFLVGLLSLLDCMLGMPMARILEHLRLSDAMSDVLLRSQGPLARHLLLAITLEKGQAEAAARYAEQIGLAEGVVADAWSEAFAWTDAALRSGA
jgi:EAL and modified HD-GYP domain-containing signal transduction protein